MYQFDFSTFFDFLLPALVPIILFVIAEIFTWRRRDERQKAIRNQAYKHAFVIFVCLFLILSQVDNYMAVEWNYGGGGYLSEGAATTAMLIAICVLIIEQIIRGSFFSSESTGGFIILMVITVPYVTLLWIFAVKDVLLHSSEPLRPYILHFCEVIVPFAGFCGIIIAAVIKHIVYELQKRRAD